MAFFILAGLLSVLFAFLSQYEGSRRLIYLSLFIIAYIIAFQDAIGCDFSNYLYFFNDILCGNSKGVLFRSFSEAEAFENPGLEIGWYYLNLILGKQFHSFYAVTVVIAIFDCFTLYQLLKRIPNKWHWVAIAYFYFQPMLFFMSGFRQGVAICFFVLAIIKLDNRSYYKALLLIFLGFTFHNSIIYGLLFIPFYYIFVSKLVEKRPKLFAVILSFLFLGGIVFANTIQKYFTPVFVEVVDAYSEVYAGYVEEMEGTSFSLLNILSKVFIFVFSIIAFISCEDKMRWILGLSILAQIGINLFGYNGSVQRVVLYASLFTVPAYSMIPGCFKDKVFKWAFAVFVLFISIRAFLLSLPNPQFQEYAFYHTIFNVF